MAKKPKSKPMTAAEIRNRAFAVAYQRGDASARGLIAAKFFAANRYGLARVYRFNAYSGEAQAEDWLWTQAYVHAHKALELFDLTQTKCTVLGYWLQRMQFKLRLEAHAWSALIQPPRDIQKLSKEDRAAYYKTQATGIDSIDELEQYSNNLHQQQDGLDEITRTAEITSMDEALGASFGWGRQPKRSGASDRNDDEQV